MFPWTYRPPVPIFPSIYRPIVHIVLSTYVPYYRRFRVLMWRISDFRCLSNVDSVSCSRTQPNAPTKARTWTLRSKFQGSTQPYYLPQYLCSRVPMLPSTYVSKYISSSKYTASPVPIFTNIYTLPNTYVRSSISTYPKIYAPKHLAPFLPIFTSTFFSGVHVFINASSFCP